MTYGVPKSYHDAMERAMPSKVSIAPLLELMDIEID